MPFRRIAPHLGLALLFLLIVCAANAAAPRLGAAPALPLETTAGAALPWNHFILTHADDAGEYPALALDAEDDIHVSYYHATDRQLHYYFQDATGATDVQMDALHRGVGKFSALALDAAGNAHISYYDEAQGALKYTYTTFPDLLTPWETVATGVGDTQTALALDGHGRPLIAYHDALAGALKVAFRRPGGGWTIETADPGGPGVIVGQDPALALDADGYPHIAYYDATHADLKYVAKDANGWGAPQVVDQSGYVGVAPSLALDYLGRPFVSYWDWGEDDLKLAEYDPEFGWQVGLLAATGSVGRYSSLALDRNGRPHLSFYRGGSGDLLYSFRKADGSWQAAGVVDSSGHTGIDNALALDSDGNPHIVYYNDTTGALRYANLISIDVGLNGNVDCPWGARDCNPCVADVEGSFARLRAQGDILGFHIPPGYPSANYGPDTTWHNHWQGAQRLMSGDGRAFVVSLDGAHFGTRAVFNVANLASRDPGGGRWRSNRLAWGEDFQHTAPPPADAVHTAQVLPSTGSHPGGIQAMGDFLAVGAGSQFYFYDLQNPWQPAQIGGYFDRGSKSSSTAALAQLSDGAYLVAISDSDAASIDFYRTETVTPGGLAAAGAHLDTWYPADEGWGWPGLYNAAYWDTFQNINLVTDCGSGDLYLIATSNEDSSSHGNIQEILGKPKWPNGDNRAWLYALEERGGAISLAYVADREFQCRYRGVNACNFDAAAGVYVDDRHQLYLYSTEHRADGPDDTVKMMAFRPVPHGGCANPADGWLELFAGPAYNGRSLMIDWIDRDRKPYENFDRVEDFEDRAASAAWCLPHDWTAVLYEHKEPCGGKEVALRGSGAFRMAGLDTFGLGNDVSCLRFHFDPPRRETYLPAQGVTIVYLRPEGAPNEVTSAGSAAGERAIAVTLPPGAFNETLELTLDAVSPPSRAIAPRAFGGMGFRLTAARDGVPLGAATFAKPATVAIQVDSADLAGLRAGSVALYYWQEQQGAWQEAHTTCAAAGQTAVHTAAGSFSAPICRFGEYALLGEPLARHVLVDELHDNTLTLDWTRAEEIAADIGYEAAPQWFYLGALAGDLAPAYALHRAAGGALTAAGLAGSDVLLVPPARAAMTPGEISAIKHFVAQGGGLVLLGDAGHTPPNPELCASFGAKPLPLPLFSPAPEPRGDIALDATGMHPALGGFSALTANWSQPLSVGGAAEVLLRTPPDAWADVNDDLAFDEGDDWRGAFNAAAALDTGCGRVAVLGDDSFSDDDLGWTDNGAAMQGLLRWAAGGRSCALDQPLQPARVLLDDAHDDQLTLDWERANQLADAAGGEATPGWFLLGELQEILAADFRLEEAYGAALTPDLLAGNDVLLIPPYREPLTAAEVTAVRQFVARGGGLLLLGDCAYDPPNPELAAAYGLGFDPACLYAPVEDGSPSVRAAHVAELPWLQGRDPLGLTWAQSLALSGAAFPLIDTAGADAWRDGDGDGRFDDGEAGVFPVAAAFDSGCGRVAAIADNSFCDDCLDLLRGWENDVALRQIMAWLAGGRACTGGPDHQLYLPLLRR